MNLVKQIKPDWHVGMTVAYRKKPTVSDTLLSLRDAGWADCQLYAEMDSNSLPENYRVTYNTGDKGNWPNFCHRLRQSLKLSWTHLLLVQDDVEFASNTRQWLEANWPINEGIVSLYRAYRYGDVEHSDPYTILSNGAMFIGTLAIAMNRDVATLLESHLASLTNKNNRQDDTKLSKFLLSTSIQMNIASVSKCKHTGEVSSVYPYTTTINTHRQASNYVEE